MTYCDHCGADAGTETVACPLCPDSTLHRACLLDHRVASHGWREPKARLKGRVGSVRRIRAEADLRADLEAAIGSEVTLGREGATRGPHRAGKGSFVTIGCQSQFAGPAGAIAAAITEALSPDAQPPRRFVPKRREKRLKTAPFLRDGKLTTHRYRGWTPLAVARAGEQGCRFLRWILEHDHGDPALLPPADRRTLVLALAVVRVASGPPGDDRHPPV